MHQLLICFYWFSVSDFLSFYPMEFSSGQICYYLYIYIYLILYIGINGLIDFLLFFGLWFNHIVIILQLLLLGGLSHWFLCPFNMTPSLDYVSSFLISFPIRCSRLILYFTCLDARISHFSRVPVIILENDIGNQDLRAGCAQCCSGAVCILARSVVPGALLVSSNLLLSCSSEI